MIQKANYIYSFNSNGGFIFNNTDAYCLGRINLETFYRMDLVRFQLSGIIDMLYYYKRLQINKIIK